MINRYTLINVGNLMSSFNIKDDNYNPIYNAYPTKKLPIITLN